MHINFQKLTHHQSFWQTFFSKFRPPTLLRPCFDLASPLLRTNSVSIPYQFRINSVKLALFTELVRNKHGINLDLYACKGEDEAKMIGGKGLCGEWRVELATQIGSTKTGRGVGFSAFFRDFR